MTTTLTTTKHINHFSNDLTTKEGVRICTPLYIDLTTAQRKEILNKVREVAYEPAAVNIPPTQSGITVENYSNREPEIVMKLGMDLANLRNALFQRGGLSVDLVLKLQAITGLVFVDQKTFAAAFKQKQAAIKSFMEEHDVNPST